MTSFAAPIAGLAGPFEVVDADTAGVLVPRLEAALTRAARKRGLLGREALAPGEGLLIAPTNAVHTFFMRFPIDIVFVARNGTVVRVSEAVPAWRLAGSWRAWAVIELGAGQARACGLSPGRKVGVRSVNP